MGWREGVGGEGCGRRRRRRVGLAAMERGGVGIAADEGVQGVDVTDLEVYRGDLMQRCERSGLWHGMVVEVWWRYCERGGRELMTLLDIYDVGEGRKAWRDSAL